MIVPNPGQIIVSWLGIPLEVSLSLKQWKKNNLAVAHADTGPTQHRLVPLCHTDDLN